MGQRSPTAKCFNQRIPYIRDKSLFKLGIKINLDIFHQAVRPDKKNFDLKDENFGFFGVNINYNNQFLGSGYRMKTEWRPRDNSLHKSFVMRLYVQNMEVLKRRNKITEFCFEGWPNFDQYLIDKITTTVGCRPPYIPPRDNIVMPNCSTKDNMRLFYKKYYQASRHEEDLKQMPCQMIEKISDSYREQDVNDVKNSSWLRLDLLFAETAYKEIERVRAYSLESLIGNAGQ